MHYVVECATRSHKCRSLDTHSSATTKAASICPPDYEFIAQNIASTAISSIVDEVVRDAAEATKAKAIIACLADESVSDAEMKQRRSAEDVESQATISWPVGLVVADAETKPCRSEKADKAKATIGAVVEANGSRNDEVDKENEAADKPKVDVKTVSSTEVAPTAKPGAHVEAYTEQESNDSMALISEETCENDDKLVRVARFFSLVLMCCACVLFGVFRFTCLVLSFNIRHTRTTFSNIAALSNEIKENQAAIVK